MSDFTGDSICLLSEKVVLAGILRYGYKAWVDVFDILNNDCFIADTHSVLFNCLEYIFTNKGDVSIDAVSIMSACNAIGLGDFWNKPDEKTILKKIKECPVEFSSVKTFASKLRKLSIIREGRRVIQGIDRDLQILTGDETASDIINKIEKPIYDFNQNIKTSEIKTPQLVLKDLSSYLDYLESNPVQQIGISTGFHKYDEAIGGGLVKGMAGMIAARFKKGKSSVADNMSINIASKMIPVCMLDTEMNKEMHYNRMLANISGVTINDIKTGQYSFNEIKKEKVRLAQKKLELCPYFYISIAGQDFEETLCVMRRWVMSELGLDSTGYANTGVIILDYLKIMNENAIQSMQEWQKFGFMATQFVNFAVKYQIPCHTFLQLNREDDVAASDRIQWYLAHGSFWFEQSVDEISAQRDLGIRDPYNFKLVTKFCRDGSGHEDGDYINMRFDKATCKITEGPTHFEMQRNSGNIAINPTNPEF